MGGRHRWLRWRGQVCGNLEEHRRWMRVKRQRHEGIMVLVSSYLTNTEFYLKAALGDD
jgi:hypothetical protein